MKISSFLTFQVIFFAAQCQAVIKVEKVLAFALKNITKKLFDDNREVVIINYLGNLSFVEKTLIKSVSDENLPFKFNNLKKIDKKLYSLKESAVLSFNSVESLVEFNNQTVLTNKRPKNLQFFVVCKKATLQEFQNIKESVVVGKKTYQKSYLYQVGSILQFQYFILNEKKLSRLLTFEWYQENKCNIPQLVEINVFNKTSKKWNNSIFSIKKFEQFNGCRLTFGVPYDNPAMSHRLKKNGRVEPWGFNLKILGAVNDYLNFSYSLNYYFEKTDSYGNKNWPVDLNVFMHKIDGVFVNELFVTQPYIFTNKYFTIPYSGEFNAYEKLILPFELDVWAWIVTTFLIAFLVIFIINFQKTEIKTFVFGKNVKTPSINVFAHFFGISQLVSPGRNFARYMLMMFILFSLIMRTAYQAKMFELLQKNINKPEIQSIAEMIDKNFTLYMKHDSFIYFQPMEIMKG